MSNSGIQISGGSINAKQMVAGAGAKAILREGVNDSVLHEAFEKLERSISESQLSEDKVKELINATAVMKSESAKAQPERANIERGLQLIEKSAGSISAVGAAIKAVMSLLAL